MIHARIKCSRKSFFNETFLVPIVNFASRSPSKPVEFYSIVEIERNEFAEYVEFRRRSNVPKHLQNIFFFKIRNNIKNKNVLENENKRTGLK